LGRKEGYMDNIIKGQAVRITTMADETIRIIVDCDVALVGDVNVLKWKNNMVLIQVIEEV
jgi:hypothetical protein